MDAEAITALSHQLGYSISLSETTANIEKVVSSKDNCIYTALCDGNTAGWIHAFIAIRIETAPFVEIGGLVVDENYRGEGVGKALIAEVKNWCLEKNINTLRVRCNTKRLEAHKFYAALGFQQNKEQKVFELAL